ncbi:hypothetical protein [Sutcliffiella deserti]|uniref:hypothetical protein n=1 Tax=Sutcliffiella deserti TaxID=2875501 RepID=UPI001CBF2562|nr:hypothetical protein [Sutcliffiella deserti]
MGICPLCNGFEEYNQTCTSCGNLLVDAGKVTDFFDDYSAYMEIDSMKEVDGNLVSLAENICMHLVSCPLCQQDKVVAINE